MISNHPQFVEAIRERKLVRIRYFSAADGGVLDRVFIPLDYGRGSRPDGEVHRYWLRLASESPGLELLGLFPQQIVDLHVTGEIFDPATVCVQSWPWTVSREWEATGHPALVTAPV